MKRDAPEKNGVRLLGSPIGSPEFKAKWIRDRIDSKLLPLLKQIEKFNQPHICLHLIRRSFSLLGLVHAARTTDPRSILPELERADELILNTLAKSVFCSNLSPAQKKLIQLPVSLGGWGFTSLKLIGLTGYIASLSTCLPQILALRPASASSLQETLDSVVELLKKNYFTSSVSFEARSSYTQKQLCLWVHEIQQETLLQELATSDISLIAAIRAQAEDKAGLWKIAPPSQENLLEGELFLHVARRSLRLPVYATQRKIGDEIFDRFGDKVISYKTGGGVTRRHNRIRDFLVKMGSEGNISQACEKTTPAIDHKRETYRADIFLYSGIPGETFRDTAIDVTVTNEFNESLLINSVRSGSAAAEHGERSKNNLLKATLSAHQIDLVPVSFGAMGGHGAQCLPYLQYLYFTRARHQNIPLGEAAATFWTSLSLTIQRQNADTLKRFEEISHAVPTDSKIDSDSDFETHHADSL